MFIFLDNFFNHIVFFNFLAFFDQKNINDFNEVIYMPLLYSD